MVSRFLSGMINGAWVNPSGACFIGPLTKEEDNIKLDSIIKIDSDSMSWNLERYKEVLSTDIIDTILSIPLPLCQNKEEHLFWPNNTNTCTIKDAYNKITHIPSLKTNSLTNWKWIW